MLSSFEGVLVSIPSFYWFLSRRRRCFSSLRPALLSAVLALPRAVALRAQLQRHVQRRRFQRHLHPASVHGLQLSLAVEEVLLLAPVLRALPRRRW